MTKVNILNVLTQLKDGIQLAWDKYQQKPTAKNKKALRIALETYLKTLNAGFEEDAIGGDPFGVYLKNGLEEGIMHELVEDIIKKNDFHVYEFASLVFETQDKAEVHHKEGVASRMKGKLANGAEYLFDSESGKISFLWNGLIRKIQVFTEGVKIVLYVIMEAMRQAYQSTSAKIRQSGESIQEKWKSMVQKHDAEESMQPA